MGSVRKAEAIRPLVAAALVCLVLYFYHFSHLPSTAVASWIQLAKNATSTPSFIDKQPAHDSHEDQAAQKSPDEKPTQPSRQYCDGMDGSDKIVVTIKTGATQANRKVPPLLKTSLRCAPNVLIFSDMRQRIGPHEVYDALEDIPDAVKNGNSDFDLYRQQYLVGDPETIMATLSGTADERTSGSLAAWTLDKYKNNHIVEKAWKMHPNRDWYVHIDADSYLVWASLLEWVRRLDASKPMYLGSLAYINNLPFAHGGSGIVMSGAAMRTFAVHHNGTAARWDAKMHDNCCGDWVLARILEEYGMGLLNARPAVQGETPATIPFDDDTWCRPLVTMHHMSVDEAEAFGVFEERRENANVRPAYVPELVHGRTGRGLTEAKYELEQTPIRYADVFNDVLWKRIPNQLPDWDNSDNNNAESPIVRRTASFEACREACAGNGECLQGVFDGKDCRLETRVVRLGKGRSPTGGLAWHSFWNRTRVERWVEKRGRCGEMEFPFQRT